MSNSYKLAPLRERDGNRPNPRPTSGPEIDDLMPPRGGNIPGENSIYHNSKTNWGSCPNRSKSATYSILWLGFCATPIPLTKLKTEMFIIFFFKILRKRDRWRSPSAKNSGRTITVTDSWPKRFRHRCTRRSGFSWCKSYKCLIFRLVLVDPLDKMSICRVSKLLREWISPY